MILRRQNCFCESGKSQCKEKSQRIIKNGRTRVPQDKDEAAVLTQCIKKLTTKQQEIRNTQTRNKEKKMKEKEKETKLQSTFH